MGLATSAAEPEAAEATHGVATVIQHHPSRAWLLPKLIERLAPLSPTVVRDPRWNDLHWDAWRAYRNCLTQASHDGTHVLVIQDDVVPCHNFGKAVPLVLNAKPDQIVCFYVGGGAIGAPVIRAGNACAHWTVLPRHLWLPVVATAIPVPIVQDLLIWAQTDTHALKARSDDSVLGRYARQRHHPIWATVPNLVQHPDKVTSLVRRRAAAGRDRHRVAACWIGDEDPLSIDWGI